MFQERIHQMIVYYLLQLSNDASLLCIRCCYVQWTGNNMCSDYQGPMRSASQVAVLYVFQWHGLLDVDICEPLKNRLRVICF